MSEKDLLIGMQPHYESIPIQFFFSEEDSETQRGIVEWKSLLLSKPLYDSFSEIVKDILK